MSTSPSKGKLLSLHHGADEPWLQKGDMELFEASHGKGAPDGVGGLLKQTADRHGHDIPSAEHLYSTLANSGTVRVFYIREDLMEEATKNMYK